MGHDIRENWHGFFLNKYKDHMCVYILYDIKDNVIYVGQTKDAKNRMVGHLGDKSYGKLIHKIVFYEIPRVYDGARSYNRETRMMMDVEYMLVDALNPMFNFNNQHIGMRNRHDILIRDYDAPEYRCNCIQCSRKRSQKEAKKVKNKMFLG